MTDKLTITVGTTSISIPCDDDGRTTPYVGVGRFIKQKLTQYSRESDGTYTILYVFAYRDVANSRIIMPRYLLDDFQNYILDNFSNVETETVTSTPVDTIHVDMKIKPEYKIREKQQAMVDFLINPNYGFKPLIAPTGSGKTFVSIKAMTVLGFPTMIVLGSLINQWVERIHDYTDIKDDEIAVVQGYDTVCELWRKIRQKKLIKVVIFAARTLFLYAVTYRANYKELPPYNELIKSLHIGTMIHDEVHLNFYTNTCIDMFTNVKHNIFLSATYERSNPNEDRIFNRVFPISTRYGCSTGEKYTDVVIVTYNRYIYRYDTRSFMLQKGYSHGGYEKYLISKPEIFDKFVSALDFAITEFFIPYRIGNQRLLVLCSTHDFVMTIADLLKYKYPAFNVKTYFAGDKIYGGQENLTADVIVSTIKSCGTGVDIPALKTCINTVSFNSRPLSAQILGRLRKIPNEITYFVDISNLSVDAHNRHRKSRLDVYGLRALSIRQHDLS